MRFFQQVPGTNGPDHKSRRQTGGQNHVEKAVGHRGVEDDLQPVLRDELADSVDGVARWGLHPSVHADVPEGGKQGSDAGGQHMQPVADPFAAKQHDAEKARLKEERRQNLASHKGANEGASLVGEH